MLGDSAADVAAAHAAGMRAGLVLDTRRCELCPLKGGGGGLADCVAARFDALVQGILRA